VSHLFLFSSALNLICSLIYPGSFVIVNPLYFLCVSFSSQAVIVFWIKK
jgi:hypothetical protein